MSSVRDKQEKEFLEFLLKRLKNAGGSLQIQHITGHLSQLSYDVRSTIGTSKSDLLHFLKKHSTVFSIDKDVVKIIDSSSSKNGGYDSDSSSIDPHIELPQNINKGKGVIIKIFPRFGFIKAKEPVKTVVYFKSVAYGNADIDLTGSLYIGAMVYFNATKKNDDSRSKYCAKKVWKVDESDIHSSVVVTKSRKSRDSGLYDPMTLDGEGVIQNLFPNLGFITVKGDKNNTVFFHKNRLAKYDNIVDLTKVLSKGDIVEFSAHRSTKQDAKARWEATKVWKKSGQIKEMCEAAESDKSYGNHSSVSKIDMKSKHNAKEMIKNQRGKICPRSQGAVIKFGQNELADGDASVYYISGCEVKDIGWEFSEGDNVFFDAVKIKSAPGWKAVLVWVGEKPDIVLPTCLGDFSEFTDDETEDNLSNYMSYSSNSSVKSDHSSLKHRKMKKGTPSSDFSVEREEKRSDMKEKLHNSFSQYNSQSSLSSSLTSKSSQKSKKKDDHGDKYSSAKNKAVSNWGDSPYPADDDDDDDDDNDDISSDNNDCSLSSLSNHNKVLKISNKKVQSKMECVDSSKKEENVKNKSCPSLEEIKNEKLVISESKAKVKEIGYVKKYKSVEGKIVRVYSKFVEAKANDKDMFSIFWNNFYISGVSVEELELDDLKEVLKIGDSIYFNYFEIVDDLGQKWQKVSLAWKDSKPIKATEMTPEDFIKHHNLSVMNCETVVDSKEEDNSLSRKYLTAVTDLDADEMVDKVSSESCAEDESDHSLCQSVPNKILPSLDYKTISNAIVDILKKDLFSDSEVDLSSVTEEIINTILENHNPRKCDDKFCQTLSQNESYLNMSSKIICTDCGQLLVQNSDKNVNTKSSEVQTIITGEIIAQNIFTEC